MEQSHINTALEYVASGTNCKRKETFYPPSNTVSLENPLPGELELKVLTPLFYSTIARYSHITEIFSAEMLHCDNKQRTFWTSDPEKLLRLFSEKHISELEDGAKVTSQKTPIRWSVLRFLRRSPQPRVSPSESQTPHPRGTIYQDIRSFRLSALDQFVLRQCNVRQSRAYRRAVTMLLLSDYIAFGISELISALDVCMRLLLCYLCVDTALHWWQSLFSPCLSMLRRDVLLSCNAIHIWWLLKMLL